MELRDIMTKQVQVVSPRTTLQEAAQNMRDFDTGILPVVDGQSIVGLLTDRDIVIRALAQGKSANDSVSTAMTDHVVSMYEDDDVEDAAELMEEKQIRRLIVLDRNQQIAGIISLADLSRELGDEELSGEILKSVAGSASMGQTI